MSTMRGVVFEVSSCKLTFSDNVPRPILQATDDVLVRITASGICGTDLHLLAGGLDEFVHEETIPGHEMVGRVEAVGRAVRGLEIGQYVALQPMGRCFECETCQAGHLNLCDHTLTGHLGYGRRGGWAELCVVGDHHVFPIADPDLPPAVAVLIEPMGGVLNGWRQLGAALTMGRRVAVLGGGLIGSLWAALLSFRGFRSVVVTEPSPERRRRVSRWPGVTGISPEQLLAEHKGRVDVVIECCAVTAALDDAMKCLTDGATVLVYGVHSAGQYLLLNLNEMMFKELSVVSALGNNHTFSEAVALVSTMHAEGVLTAETVGLSSYRLEDFERALGDLTAKTVTKAVLEV